MADILLLLSDSVYSGPLRAACGAEHTVMEQDHLTPDASFDLCIADAPAFLTNLALIRARKLADGHTFTPILILARTGDMEALAPHVGTLIDDMVALTGEPLSSALRQMVLRARLQHLLRSRKISARLARDQAARANEQDIAVEEQKRARLAALNLMQDAQIAQARAEQALARSRESEAILALLARRAQALLELPQAAERLGDTEFIQLALGIAEETTGSRMSFAFFISGDENVAEQPVFSRRALEQNCHAPTDFHYPIEQAGVWAEALRGHAPFVCNDYPGCPKRHGLPAGHVPLQRVLSTPVMEAGRGVMVLAVGNKEADYNDFDVESTKLFADLIWRTTQRKRAVQALRESEERYKLVTETSNDAIWLYNMREDAFTYVSPSIFRLSGYTPEEAAARGLQGMLSPESYLKARALISATIDACSRGDTSILVQRHDLMQVHKHGGEVPVEIVATVITDAAGNPTHIQGVTRDMSARRASEQAIRKSNELLQSVLESVPVRVFWKDCESRYLGCNTAFARDAGATSPLSVIGRTDLDLPWKAEAESYRADDRWVLASGISKIDYEEPQTTPTGETIWLRTSKVPMRDEHGQVVGVLGVYQDITDSKRIHDQVRKLAQAVEQSAESIVITNVTGEIEYVNETFVRLSGYTREEVMGRNPKLLQSGKTPPATYREMWNALTQGHAWKGEFHNRMKDGREFVEFALVTPLRAPDGRITHYVAVKEDITEKKHVAAELDRHRFHLEELVQQRTRELSAASAEAKAATIAKSDFIANMSHEIRTPLNAIVGLAHLMRRAGVAPHQIEQLDKIDRAARHLLSLINDILDFSKIEAGKLHLEETDFSPAAILGNVVSLVSEQARERKIGLVTDAGPLPDLVRGDPTRLTQALLNLVTNAVKFTERGKVTLRAHHLQGDEGGDILLRFEVEDTGIGIRPEVLSRLFLPFEQADPSTTRKHGGTGLGLAITRRYAELMGGAVEARSTAGEGSTFVLTVRLAPADGHGIRGAMPEREAEHALAREHRGTRVLLVDDDPINQEVALELLQSVGLAADLAEDGAAAVARFKAAGDYALILMDVRMPVMDGMEATRQIRTLPNGEAVPVIAMTANAFAEDRVRCMASGMNDFIGKPVDPDLLFATMLRWLPRRTGDTPPSPASSPITEEATASENETVQRLSGIQGLDPALGLRSVRGNVASYVVLLRRFGEGHGLDAPRIRERLDASDFSEARRIAHSLKGAAASLGVTKIQSLASKLETAVLNRDGTGIESLLGTLTAELQRIRAAIWSALPPDSAPASETVDWGQVQATLGRLEQLLARGDMQAGAVFQEAAPTLRAALGQRAQQMERMLGDFDYEQAAALLATIRAELIGTLRAAAAE